MPEDRKITIPSIMTACTGADFMGESLAKLPRVKIKKVFSMSPSHSS